MAETGKNLYISNMEKTLAHVQSYSLFGESTHLPDVLHCETIADRSELHDWELAPHRHARLHQVLLIANGGGWATLDGKTQALPTGSLVNVPPEHVHSFRFEKDTRGWVTTLADELLDELLVGGGTLRSELDQACVLSADTFVTQTVHQIWLEFSAQEKARALVLRGLSGVLLGWVARQLAQSTLADAKFNDSELVQRFKELIELNFKAHWSVSQYAKALSISPTHLSRLTRAANGSSALRMIEARLMREARRNLAYTNLSISSIAYTLGFTDPAYFSRVFTRDAGISPKAFRAQI
ncbi:MAG: helix-turn-helix domain-containing protein [Limnohabitans sp.]|nr:Arabinose operon regulatory protein [Limnohabitans sp. 103DPR2]MBU3722813.1 helix-turn-helix domain-containing protein [Limnohabitans sp.]